MSLSNVKSHLEITNPYLPASSTSKAETFHPALENGEINPLVKSVDQVVEWGQNALFKDYERRVDFASIGARSLDYGVFASLAGMQGAVIVDNLFRLTHYRGFFDRLPAILKVVAMPAAIFFFIFGIIEGFAEFVGLRRSVTFLEHMEKDGATSVDKLTWLKNKYLTISGHESEKIQSYIETHLPLLSNGEKALRYEQIAEKALDLHIKALSRRVTPGLAEHVVKELPGILEGLSDPSRADYAESVEKGNLLIDSLTEQSKVKILVHLVALAAIGFTLISVIGVFAGLTFPAFFLVLGGLAATFTLLSLVIDKQVVNKEATKFYDKFVAIQQIEGAEVHPQGSLEDLAHSQT